MRSPVLVLGCLLASTAVAQQIPIPAFTNTYSYVSHTRGFYFQAPTPFVITGLRVPDETLNGTQNTEIVLLSGDPLGGPATITSSLFYSANQPSQNIIPCSALINQGDWVGILGACGTTTMHNSYGPSGFPSNVLGLPITLSRLMLQSNLNTASGLNQPVYTNTASIGRVEVYTAPPVGVATGTPYGDGCNEEYASFYENHSAFDLSNTSLSFTNAGTGYVVLPGTTAVATPTAAPTAFGDDVVVPFPLGWTLPYPGGTTSDLYVSSNGFCHLVPQTGSGCCAFNLTMFLTMGPVFAAKWRDLNPAAGGTVTLESDPVAGTATVTFDQVPDFGSANPNTFQYYFDSNGNVELRFGTVDPTAGGTGWSPGAANLDPGSIDLSATPVILTGPVDVVPLSLTADARPVIGTTVNLTVGNIPTGAVIAAVIYGLTEYNPGLDLSSIGMPGCSQYCSQDSVALIIAPVGSASHAFVIPNDPGLVGVDIESQGAAYDPAGGHNPLGALSSNGWRFDLDVN